MPGALLFVGREKERGPMLHALMRGDFDGESGTRDAECGLKILVCLGWRPGKPTITLALDGVDESMRYFLGWSLSTTCDRGLRLV